MILRYFCPTVLILEYILNNTILRDASMVIVAGDMNVDICNVECTQTENYLSLLHSLNFFQLLPDRQDFLITLLTILFLT